jgi:hypothetical protein
VFLCRVKLRKNVQKKLPVNKITGRLLVDVELVALIGGHTKEIVPPKQKINKDLRRLIVAGQNALPALDTIIAISLTKFFVGQP